nr:class I SAM-dependent methyltransferase [uncultured Draconibacterium sp.]
MIDSKKTIYSANNFAPNYDDYIKNCQWIGTDILFGLMFEYIDSNQKLLDIGIGTGLSSRLFKQVGLQIYGLDGSSKMIDICQSKGFADKLKVVDLTKHETWFKNVKFNHIISHGVFHLIGNLEFIFHKTHSILNTNGCFGFTFEKIINATDNYEESSISGLFERKNKESGITVYRHTEEYILGLMKLNRFHLLKQTEFLAYKDSNTNTKTHFNIIIAQKK